MRNYNKNKIMAEATQKLTELIKLEHPRREITVKYMKIGTQNYGEFCDFQKDYFKIHLGDEYILIYGEDNVLIYAVNVTYDSMLTAVYEAMKLIATKF